MARLNIQRRKKKNITGYIFLLIFFLLLSFASGYFVGVNSGKVDVSEQEEAGITVQEPETGLQQPATPDLVERIMSEMTVSDMVYQMMFVTPESITNVGAVIQAGETTKKAIEQYPVGGLVYFDKNFETREQTVTMLKNTQSFSKIPLFLGVDEEGGRVSRVGKNPEMGVTHHPPMKQIGDTNNKAEAYAVGQTLGRDLSALGLNVNFAPVADVLVSAGNEEIGDRSFGTEPDAVSAMVEEIVKGMEENGLSAVLKHFPGHGSTQANSHLGTSESIRTLDEIKSAELLPFVSGIHAGAGMVMVSHMTLTNATEEKVPCSVSKEIITDLLINDLGYNGLIITDSFQMKAITERYTAGEAAVKAVEAGVDMILMPASLTEAHKAIVDAVDSGAVSKKRIEHSVRKILTVKHQKGMLK